MFRRSRHRRRSAARATVSEGLSWAWRDHRPSPSPRVSDIPESPGQMLGGLPRTRSQRPSARRIRQGGSAKSATVGAARPAPPVTSRVGSSSGAATKTRAHRAPVDGGGRPQVARDGSVGPKPIRRAIPTAPATRARPPSTAATKRPGPEPLSAPQLIGALVKAPGELARLGGTLGVALAKRTLSRLPRP